MHQAEVKIRSLFSVILHCIKSNLSTGLLLGVLYFLLKMILLCGKSWIRKEFLDSCGSCEYICFYILKNGSEKWRVYNGFT